jgi:outer membrane protein assembly factor BamB
MKKPILTTLFIATALGLQAGDWPQWRGPNRDGISRETGLHQAWPSAGPKRVWLSRDIGIGYSAPVVANGRLFVMGTKGGKEQLFAKEAKSGKTLWTAELGGIFNNSWGDGPRGSATVDGAKVFALGAGGGLICANTADGQVNWRVELTGDLGGETPKWGYSESVLVDGNFVICTPGGDKGTLAVLDKTAGEVKWRSGDWTDEAQYTSVIPADHNGQRQYIQLTMKTLAGVSAEDGKVLWRNAWRGRTAVVPTPIFRDGQVYISSGYGVGCRKITLKAGHKVVQDYHNRNIKNQHGGVLLHDGHLYGYSDGRGWTCQNFETGEVVWDSKEFGKGCVTYADSRLYCLEESSGTVALASADTAGWKEHGRFKLEPQTEQRKPAGRVWTHPVVANGVMYLRDQELLFAFDVRAK